WTPRVGRSRNPGIARSTSASKSKDQGFMEGVRLCLQEARSALVGFTAVVRAPARMEASPGCQILRGVGLFLNDGDQAARRGPRRNIIMPPRAPKVHIATVAGSGAGTASTSSPSTLVPLGLRSSAPTPDPEELPPRVPYWLARSNCVAAGPNCVFGSIN